MKNKIICLVLCIVALAASVVLLVDVINKDIPVINVPEKKEEKPDIPVKPDDAVSTVELSEDGVAAFADRIESFVERLAYGNDKSYETEIKYILNNAKTVGDWLAEQSDADGSAYYGKISTAFETAKSNAKNDSDFSQFVTNQLKALDEGAQGLDGERYPIFDTSSGGTLSLALLSINESLKYASFDHTNTFTVTVGGTALLGDRIGTADDKSFKHEYDKSAYSFPFYKLSSILAHDDLSLITLMAPFTESNATADGVLDPVKGHPSYAESLFGIDGVSIAPTEIMSYDKVGYDDTVASLIANNISYSVQEGSKFIDTAFGKVVYITFDLTDTEVSDDRMNINRELVKQAVTTEKDNGADLVIVQLHWNTRLRESTAYSADYLGTVTSPYEQHFDAYNKEIGREAIRAGADLVVGTGAHVVQGIELYRDKYIVYSPGNLTYSGNLDPDMANTAYAFMFSQTFTKTDDGVKPASTRIIPIVNNSEDSPLCPTPVFDAKADEIVSMVISQSSYFNEPVTSIDYIKINK